jgi:competence protein ComEC
LFCLFAFYIIGFVRGHIANTISNSYNDISGTHTEILADSVSDSQPKAHGQVAVELKEVGYNQKILALVSANQDPQFGMRWVLSGTLHPSEAKSISYGPDDSDNGDNFDYGGYLRSKNIYATVASPQMFLIGESATKYSAAYFYNFIISAAYELKEMLYAKILQKYDYVSGNLLKAILFGDKSGLDQDQIQEYIRSGSVHLIAVSGYKLTLLLIFLQMCLRPFLGKKMIFVINSLVCFWYSAVFSFAMPILRVVLMSATFSIAEFFGGGYDSLRILIFTAAVMAFQNPLALAYDSSFLLSFLGVFGIIFFSPIIHKYLLSINIKSPRFTSEFFFAPLSAFILTLPISVYSYGELSLIGPIASLLLMPLLSPCIVLGYLSALPVLGGLAATVNKNILWYFNFLPEKLSALSFSSMQIHFDGVVVYLVYLIFFSSFAYLKYKRPFAKMI